MNRQDISHYALPSIFYSRSSVPTPEIQNLAVDFLAHDRSYSSHLRRDDALKRKLIKDVVDSLAYFVDLRVLAFYNAGEWREELISSCLRPKAKERWSRLR